MNTLSVSEYSTYNQLSKSAVYKAIKAGKLATVIVEGVTHIYIDDTQTFNDELKNLQLKINHLETELKLKDQLIKSMGDQINLYRRILPPPPPAPAEKTGAIEVETIDTKSAKKKKKSKKKGKK